MHQIVPVFKREFLGYFRSPIAYVFLIVFLTASVGLAFFLGNFFESGTATLDGFFMFHPWLFLFLIPAAGMRLWAEEKRGGTVELLFTLPITVAEAVIAKFLAAWAFICLAIFLTFPMPLTVAYLGDPDWGVMLSGYLGSMLMAGAYLGVCSLTSSFTKNQVISFVVSVLICLILVFLGWSVFADFLSSAFPIAVVDAISNFSFTTHFTAFVRGIVDLKDVTYFLSLTFFCLLVNVIVLQR